MADLRFLLRKFVKWVAIPLTTFLLYAMPTYAISNTNSMLADPKRYFPGCTCQIAFLSFVVWMIALLIIAMFQYGEVRKRKLKAYGFSIIAIILAFIIYSIPLWAMMWILKPSSFELNPDTGTYKFSQWGEKETETMQLTGEYTQEEVIGHITRSRTGVITSWAILTIVCIGTMATIPGLLKRAEERKKQPPPRHKRRKPTGHIGTKKVKPKEEKGKKGRKDKET